MLKSQILATLCQSRWGIGILLLLLVLAGCLTSHAADLPDQVPSATPGQASDLAEEPIEPIESPGPVKSANSSVVQNAPPPTMPGVTTVPNTAVRPLQETTPTLTATVTPTVAPTEEPTATQEPTETSQPTATATATPEPPTETPRPTATEVPRDTTPPSTPAPFRAYAWVDNYYPAPGSVVTVHGMLLKNGRPVNGAQMGSTWRYTHGEAYCTAYTGIDGKAACSLNIGGPLQNYWVYIDVVFIHEDELYYAKTGFVTDP